MLLYKVDFFLVCLFPVWVEAQGMKATVHCVKLRIRYATRSLLGLRVWNIAIVVTVHNQCWDFDLFKVDLLFVFFDVSNKSIHEARVHCAG